MGVNEDNEVNEVNEKLNKPKRSQSFFAKAGNIFGRFFVGGRRKNRKTRKNKKRKSKKSKKNIKKKAPTKKRRVRKNKKTKRKKGGTKRKMDHDDFKPIATNEQLEKDLEKIKEEEKEKEKRIRLETSVHKQEQEKLEQKMLNEFDGQVLSPGDHKIDIMRRELAEQELAANAARPASAPALTHSRVEVGATLYGPLGPVDLALDNANAAAREANYKLALNQNQTPSI
tara:strand:+ start:5177 stop:5860 length:684 start_codon:yes stop_codon:yes gene_type:complete